MALDTSRTLAKEVEKHGKLGTISLDGMTIEVEITDARTRYGQTDYLITPVAGHGSKWTPEHKVT